MGASCCTAALRHATTGEGQHVDVSLLDSIIYQSNGYLTLGATGDSLERWGSEVEYVRRRTAMSAATDTYSWPSS